MGWRLAGTSYGGAAGPPGPPGPSGTGGGAIYINDGIDPVTGLPIAELTNDSPTGGGQSHVPGAASIAGCPVYLSHVGHFAVAKADNITRTLVIGILLEDCPVGQAKRIQTTGKVTLTAAQWDAVTGDVGGLSPQVQYWLSPDNAGAMVKDPAPSASGNFVELIGEALTATTLELQIVQPIGPIP